MTRTTEPWGRSASGDRTRKDRRLSVSRRVTQMPCRPRCPREGAAATAEGSRGPGSARRIRPALRGGRLCHGRELRRPRATLLPVSPLRAPGDPRWRPDLARDQRPGRCEERVPSGGRLAGEVMTMTRIPSRRAWIAGAMLAGGVMAAGLTAGGTSWLATFAGITPVLLAAACVLPCLLPLVLPRRGGGCDTTCGPAATAPDRREPVTENPAGASEHREARTGA
jgi:hypothetical protein